MSERAAVSRHYRIRILIIALACLGMGSWFLYDGYVKYPRMKQTHERFVTIKEQYPVDWQERWSRVVADEGVSDQPQAKTDMDIWTQKLLGYLLMPVGVVVLMRLVLGLGRWIEMDEQGLRDNAGRRIGWDRIAAIDKSRWDRKGIAVVHYRQDGGSQGRLVLDDWKFDRQPIVAMVDHIDAHLAPESPAPPESPESPESPEAA